MQLNADSGVCPGATLRLEDDCGYARYVVIWWLHRVADGGVRAVAGNVRRVAHGGWRATYLGGGTRAYLGVLRNTPVLFAFQM